MNSTGATRLRRTVGVVAVTAAALLTAATPATAAPTATVAGTLTGPAGEVLEGVPVSVTGLHPQARYGAGGGTGRVCATSKPRAGDPHGLAAQCAPVAFSPTQQSTAAFRMVVGGGIQATLAGDVGFLPSVYIEWNGQRIEGYPTSSTQPAVYSITGVPAGTYVVHAGDLDGHTALSAPVRVVQGEVTRGITLTLR